MSPVLGRPPRAPRSHPVKPGAQDPGVGKGTTASESRPEHHAGPQGKPERHTADHNQGTRTGAKQQWPPGAANLESAHNTQRTTAREQVPSNTSRRPDGRVRTPQRAQSLPATEQTPSRWRSARPEGTGPLPPTKSRGPDGQVRTRQQTQPLPATNSRRQDGRVCAPQRRPAQATHSTTHGASTPVNRGQEAQDTAHRTQHTERLHR